jgi:hypothetical protein
MVYLGVFNTGDEIAELGVRQAIRMLAAAKPRRRNSY